MLPWSSIMDTSERQLLLDVAVSRITSGWVVVVVVGRLVVVAGGRVVVVAAGTVVVVAGGRVVPAAVLEPMPKADGLFSALPTTKPPITTTAPTAMSATFPPVFNWAPFDCSSWASQ